MFNSIITVLTKAKPKKIRFPSRFLLHYGVPSIVLSTYRYNREKYRKYKKCPVAGCKSKAQKKLSNHLTYSHPSLTAKERRQMLMLAEKVSPHYFPKVTNQSTLNFTPMKKKEKTRETVNSSRGLSSYPLTNRSLNNFYLHLKQLDGGRRNDNAAKAICKDVSKFLYFCSSKNLNMDYMVDVSKVSF